MRRCYDLVSSRQWESKPNLIAFKKEDEVGSAMLDQGGGVDLKEEKTNRNR